MTTALILAIAASCFPACFAITQAKRAGVRGPLPYAVWVLEAGIERQLRLTRWLRDFHAWNAARRTQEAR